MVTAEGTRKDPNISQDQIRNAFIVFPPKREQIEIADFLTRETAKIDTLIAKQEWLIELLQEKRQALISHAVTKGLNPDAPMKDSGIEWLGEIPAHWEVVRNKAIFFEVDQRSSTGEEELLTVSHITGVTPRSEKNVNMFLAESLEGYKRCEQGDLIINTMWAWMGALGTTKHVGVVSPSYNVYRSRKPQQISQTYFDCLYRIPEHISEIRRWSKGVWESRLRLYPDSFFSMSSPLPPLQEQVEIAKFIEKENERMDILTRKAVEAIEYLKEHRTALISAAVTGKIDVREIASDAEAAAMH